jgi:hypothetical protein
VAPIKGAQADIDNTGAVAALHKPQFDRHAIGKARLVGDDTGLPQTGGPRAGAVGTAGTMADCQRRPA